MEWYGIGTGQSIHLATHGSALVSPTRLTGHANFDSPRARRGTWPNETNDDLSWVMLKQNGDIEPLEGETVLLRTPGKVSLELKVADGLRTPNSSFAVKCNDGVAYVTTQRVSHIPGVLSCLA